MHHYQKGLRGTCRRPWASPVVRVLPLKSLPESQETWVRSLGGADPLEEGPATHSSILAQRILWTGEPGGLQSMALESRTPLKQPSMHAEETLLIRNRKLNELGGPLGMTRSCPCFSVHHPQAKARRGELGESSAGWPGPTPACLSRHKREKALLPLPVHRIFLLSPEESSWFSSTARDSISHALQAQLLIWPRQGGKK